VESASLTPESFWPWLVIGVFVLSSALNYLDRQLLAALAPTLKGEFHLTNAQYGMILSAFSIVYTIATPPAGWFVDRVGLNRGICLALIAWSLTGSATGLVQSFEGLLVCRAMLGTFQSAGIPSAGKAIATYLQPRELAIGRSLNTIGVNLGSVAAPLAAALIAPLFGWRVVFIACGALGLLWAPLWLVTANQSRRCDTDAVRSSPVQELLVDGRLWAVAAATALIMTVHTLWMNWTTVFLVHAHQLTELEANRQLAWIPALCGAIGGFFGGYLSYRWIGGGMDTLKARVRVGWFAGPALLITAIVPFIPSAPWAVAAIGLSLFCCTAITTNLNVIPLDLFGTRNAAFSISIVNCSYGLMQAVVSPAIGAAVDRFGFSVVCLGASLLAMAGLAVTSGCRRPAAYC
jgi:ACS family hexuronate transporter-like MFS transporter